MKCQKNTPEVSKIHLRRCQKHTEIILIRIRLMIVILISFLSGSDGMDISENDLSKYNFSIPMVFQRVKRFIN